MRRILTAGVAVAAAIVLAAPMSAQSRGSGGRRSPSRLQAPAPAVPGIGFDYAHLAAITPRTQISRSDPGPARGQFLTPIFNWGWPVYSAPQPPPQPVTPQPIVIVLQQPPPTVVTVPAPGAREDAVPAEAAPPSVSPAQAPLRELSPFTLLRRDGQIVLAVLFGVSGDLLTYINQDGARRSFPLAELDAEATLQMNEAAGRSMVLPH